MEKEPHTESKQESDDPKMSTEFSDSAFSRIDNKIEYLVQKILPSMPHLLSVPTKNPYQPNFPYENRNTPFEDWEVKHLQYMTLLSSGATGYRGVALARGDWEDEINAESPQSAVPSVVNTPRSERDPSKPRVKMSFNDYKAGKRPTSSSQPARSVPPPATQNAHNGAAGPPVSPTQQMIDQIIQSSSQAHKPMDRFRERQNIAHPDTNRLHLPKRPDSPPYILGASEPLPPQTLPKPEPLKERTRVERPPIGGPEWKEKLQSPRAQAAGPPKTSSQQPKRHLDITIETRPEKRAKLEYHHSPQTDDLAQHKSLVASAPISKKAQLTKDIPRKSGVPRVDENLRNINQPAGSPRNVNIKTTKAPALPQKKERLSNGSLKEDPVDAMPPLLSPLPAGLDSPTDRGNHLGNETGKGKKPEQISPTGSASKLVDSGVSQETRTAGPSDDDDGDDEFPLPPLLSPLPDWIMEQMAREKEEIARLYREREEARANTVGARRERSRQPDTPGVARKTTKAHPAPATATKNLLSDASSSIMADARPARKSLIVKIKYGKRNKIAIGRILNLTARPGTEQKHSHSASGTSRMIEGKTHAASSSLGSEGRKHRQVDEPEEPSAKRSKVSVNLEAQRARTPLTPSIQSPAPSAPSTSQKPAFNTPKKDSTMKSVAMRRVDSNEGRVSTPQGGFTSAPASTEKLRINGSESKSAEADALNATFGKYITLGTALKRQADQILKAKETNPGPISEEDKKLGAVIALESVLAYMISFNAYDTMRQIERKSNTGDNWIQFFPFLDFAISRARPYMELYTVALLLSVVCREAVDRIYSERMVMDPASASRDFLKEVHHNSRARQAFLHQYVEQNKVFPVDLVVSVVDAKLVAFSVLGEFCTKNGLAWEKRVEL